MQAGLGERLEHAGDFRVGIGGLDVASFADGGFDAVGAHGSELLADLVVAQSLDGFLKEKERPSFGLSLFFGSGEAGEGTGGDDLFEEFAAFLHD